MRVSEVQHRLKALGFDPGPVDGIWGRKSIAATKAFQRSSNLVVDGVVGRRTLALLFPEEGEQKVAESFTPWFKEAERKKGLHESKDKEALARFLRSDGATLGDPTKLPWCGDLIETCIALTLPDEPMISNPYWARNWLDFGKPCKPTLGCVLIFSRGPNSGHVGFYAGEDKNYFSVLGGNQGNSISISRVAKTRLLGSRWPTTVPLGPTVMVAGGNAVITSNEA